MFPKRWGYLVVSLDEPKIFPRAPLAFDIISNMKKALMIFSVVLLAAEATAYVGGHQRGYKNGDTSKGITKGGASEVKEKGAAEKKTRAKAKEITETKIEIPKDATYNGLAIDHSGRVLSLCGFEIGEIAKVPRHPVLDKDGNIVMTGKLAKPFRRCTQYELKYSRVNHALYSIRVFSPAQKKMDDEAAAAELEAMAAAVKAKFEGQVLSWQKLIPPWHAQMKLYAHQSLTVNSFKDTIDKKYALKGTAESKSEKGWAFSVTLTDRVMHDYVPKAPESDVETPEGVDAL